jgi:methionyl aminopeptidase
LFGYFDKKLIEVTEQALARGIKAAKPGNTLGDIGYAIGDFVQKKGFYVAEGLTGHGIGTKLHEDPSVFNEGRPGKGMKLVPGMTLALEPMVIVGTSEVVQLADESYGSANRKNSAHFEHTIVITEKGNRILTE